MMGPQDHLETLSEGYPFYLISNKKDKDGNKLAITLNTTEIYYPRVYNIFNVYLDKFEGKEHPNTLQQWVWNTEEGSLKNVHNPKAALFEGFNQNMIAYNWKGFHNQRFKYNLGTKRIENVFTGRAMDIKGDKIVAGVNILTDEPDSGDGQKWLIDY